MTGVAALHAAGDCLADLGLLRAEPGVCGAVASETTVSRTLTTLAGDVDAAVRAINRARVSARQRAWGRRGPGHAHQVMARPRRTRWWWTWTPRS